MEANKVTDYDWEVEKCFHAMIEIKKEIVSVHHNIKEAQARYKKDFEKKLQQKEVKLN